jgi:hypothetical protein
LAGVAFAGLATAYVLPLPADGSTAVKNGVTICHATSSKTNPFVEQIPSAEGVLSGHADHPDDIIPPFEVVVNGKTVVYPGKNLDKLIGGYTGLDVLANGCGQPVGRVSTTTLPAAVTEPGTTITTPATTELETVTEKIIVPSKTTTAPPTSAVVTIPPGETTTVTIPERIVTVPASTETVHGEEVIRPRETVTLPEMTRTETGGATTTVETVSVPDKVVEPGEHGAKVDVVTVTIPARTVTEPPQVVPAHEHHHPGGETVVETVPTMTTVPATTVTVPGTTTTETRIEKLVVPAETVHVAEESTVVTVPAGETTTVTLPERTVTVPTSRETINGETVLRPAEVVTVPSTIRRVAGGNAATVVTVTGNDQVVEDGNIATKRIVVAVTTQTKVVREPAHVVRAVEKRLVLVVRIKSCPAGTALFNGHCFPIARGSG